MDPGILTDIVTLCLKLERQAVGMYLRLADQAVDERLRRFWAHMSAQESGHVEYWERLLQLARNEALPQVFERPDQILRDLRHVEERVDELEKLAADSPSTENAFLLAYRMEFYLLTPALTTLFHYVRTTPGEQSPVDVYEDHLSGFIGTLNKYSTATPGLELLGETIQRLWKDNRRLTSLSHVDPLTGVLNRRGLEESIHPLAYLARRGGYPVGVLLIDIDNFKEVNDRLGHPAGDEALRRVAGIVRGHVRKSDLVGRWGGEEFLVFLSPLEPESLSEVAEALRLRIGQDTASTVPLTVSLGGAATAIRRDVEGELAALIRLADERLLAAKRLGKNRVVAS